MASKDEQSDVFLSSDSMSDEFFTDIVEKKLKIARDKFKLRLVLISPAAGKNENFVCVVYRAKVKIQLLETKENVSVDVIIKALVSNLKEFKEFGVFPRERFMYENVLKSFEDIWYERTGKEIQFAPRSIKFETDPYELIVMDDLKAMGYEMIDRKIGADFVQTKIMLAKLAQFHAASAVRFRKDGMIKEYLDRKQLMPMMTEDNPFMRAFARQQKVFAKSLWEYGDCDVYAEKISRWNTKNFQTIFLDVAEPMRCGFIAVSHGDIWLNNMMFLSNEQKETLDVIFYDFQGSCWATPTNDLLYFLVSSVSDEAKVEHFDDFIEYYHAELKKSLKELAYDQHIPTLSELFIDIMEKGQFAAICLMFILTIVKNDSSEEINFEAMMGEDVDGTITEMLNRIYRNETYKKALKVWLPFMNKRGFLDTMLPADA